MRTLAPYLSPYIWRLSARKRYYCLLRAYVQLLEEVEHGA